MKRNPASEERPDSDRYIKDAEDRFFFDSTSGIYKPKSCKTEPKSSKEASKSSRFWVTTIISTLTLLAVGFYAYYAALQWCEMKRAADAAKKAADAATSSASTAAGALAFAQQQFRQDQRPYIALPELPPGAPNSGRFGVHEGRIRVLLPIQNYGKSPALNTFAFARVAIGDDDIRRINFNRAGDQDIGIVPPGIFPPISAFSEVLRSPDDVKRPMVVYGRIDYTDIFAPPNPKYSLVFCQAANVEVTVTPSDALRACKGKNYIQ